MNRARHCSYFGLAEPLLGRPGAVTKRMFGCDALYLEGRLVLVAAEDKEPWRGLLFPVERTAQPAAIAEFPALAPHPVLGKWLYPDFADWRSLRASEPLFCDIGTERSALQKRQI